MKWISRTKDQCMQLNTIFLKEIREDYVQLIKLRGLH
jgi:hypothetical protein